MNASTNATCGDSEMVTNAGLYVLDWICTVFFTLELLLRFLSCPSKLAFVTGVMNVIDLLALVPLYVQILMQQNSCFEDERFVIEIMFILRIFRMFRIFHLVKHYQALKVLVYALMTSLQELLMLFIFLLIGMLIFATMIYYAERKRDGATDAEAQPGLGRTIPLGFWWAIITMTTVGYGDISPASPVGYVVGSACSICGVLLLALTIPVISNNFTLFYEHVRSRANSPPTKKDAAEGEEEDEYEEDEYEEEFVRNYGSLKMQSINGNGSNGIPSNGIGTRVISDDKEKIKIYVPMARFGDDSSMNDIVVQEPTDKLTTGITPQLKRQTELKTKGKNSVDQNTF